MEGGRRLIGKRLRGIAVLASVVAAIGMFPINARAAVTLTTGAEVNINNINSDIDYKLTKDELESTHDTVLSYTNLKSLDRDESDLFMTTDFLRNVSDLEYHSAETRDAKVWLIENNVYSRPVSIDLNTMKVTRQYSEVKADYEAASKSDFMMMLYKAECGVIPSNIVNVGKLTLMRENSGTTGLGMLDVNGPSSIANYWDDGVNASFGNDNINYISANVYELYLEQMLNCGIISYDDLGKKDKDGKDVTDHAGTRLKNDLFSKDGAALKNATGSWRKNAINYFKSDENCLGYSNSFKDGVVTEGSGNYFATERMSTLEALHYIAEFMRQYENISNTEADMIAYKYGLTEFANVPQEYLEDVYYLVGAGIISFDGSGPKYFLSDDVKDGYLTQGEMFDLMYRVANKGARFTFNIIQLSDAETTLKDMGFLKNDYSYITPSALPLEMSNDFNKARQAAEKTEATGNVGNDVVVAAGDKTFLDWIAPTTIVYAASNIKDYKVTKQFDYEYNGKITGNIYKYYSTLTEKWYTISDSKDEGYLGNAVGGELSMEVDSVTQGTVGNYNVYTVVFNVKAYNKAAALKKVNQRIMHTAYSNDVHSISALTKVEVDGQQVTMISQESLKGIDEIVILHDRVLLNSKTKAKCLIQNSLTKASNITTNTQYGYAIVGSQILSGEPVMIEGSDDSVYYNLKCVLALLPSSSYADLGFGTSSKVNNTLLGIALHNESISTYTYGMLQQDTSKFTYIRLKKSGTEADTGSNANAAMYNMTNLYKGMTTLSRTFNINFGNDNIEKVTFIMDLAYYAPEVDSEVTYDTFDDYQLALTTAPTETESAAFYHYWRRNYALSNALCNMMYGTKDKVYVKSGYFIPKLSILLPKSFEETENGYQRSEMFSTDTDAIAALKDTTYYKVINQFMYENLHISSEYDDYLPNSSGGNKTIDAWWTTYFCGKSGIKKQFKALLGDADEAAQMAAIYKLVYAVNIEVAIADTEDSTSSVVYFKTTRTGENDTSTNTSISGNSTSTTKQRTRRTVYAMLTDCNILYRNVAYPKTIAQESGGGSVLSVSYKNKKQKVIKNVIVTMESTKETQTYRGGVASTISKVYKKSNDMMSVSLPYNITESGKDYVLTPMFAPILMAGDADAKMYCKTLVPLDKDGKQISTKGAWKDKIVAVFDASLYEKPDNKGGGDRYKNVTPILKEVSALQTTCVLPKSSANEKNLGKGTVATEFKNLLAECPFQKELVGDYTKSVCQMLGVQKGMLKRFCKDDAGGVEYGYIYSDCVLIVSYNFNNVGKDKTNNAWIPATSVEKVKYTDLFDKDGNTKYFYTVKNERREVSYFCCYKYYAPSSSYYIDETKNSGTFTYVPSKDDLSDFLKCADLNRVDEENKARYLHKELPIDVELSQNFYATALNDQVIKATVASKMELTDVDDLPDGARLNIGESVWVKRGEYWESYPINVVKGKANKKWKSILSSGNSAYSQKKCYTVLCSIWSGYSVTLDGNSYFLYNYIDTEGDTPCVDIGTGYRGGIPTSANVYTKYGLLAKKGNDIVVYKSSDKTIEERGSSTGYKFITLKFKFKEGTGLKALPLNAANTEYDFMFNADAYSSGMDIAIFSDDLDMKYDSDVQVTVTAKDNDMDNVLKITNKEFKKGFVKANAIDWYQWVRFATLIATCWLFFMLWFAYIILQRGIAYKFFETLAKPGFRKQGKGLDVIKLFTLGILNVDSQPSIKQMAGMTVILIFIDVIVGYIL